MNIYRLVAATFTCTDISHEMYTKVGPVPKNIEIHTAHTIVSWPKQNKHSLFSGHFVQTNKCREQVSVLCIPIPNHILPVLLLYCVQ